MQPAPEVEGQSPEAGSGFSSPHGTHPLTIPAKAGTHGPHSTPTHHPLSPAPLPTNRHSRAGGNPRPTLHPNSPPPKPSTLPTNRHSRADGNPRPTLHPNSPPPKHSTNPPVIPAQAGTHGPHSNPNPQPPKPSTSHHRHSREGGNPRPCHFSKSYLRTAHTNPPPPSPLPVRPERREGDTPRPRHGTYTPHRRPAQPALTQRPTPHPAKPLDEAT